VTRWLAALVAWVVSTAVLAPLLFVVVMVLAGPHSSMLPSAMQAVALMAGWITLFVVPVWIARKVWLRG
jgi:hypothetical protein